MDIRWANTMLGPVGCKALHDGDGPPWKRNGLLSQNHPQATASKGENTLGKEPNRVNGPVKELQGILMDAEPSSLVMVHIQHCLVNSFLGDEGFLLERGERGDY